MSVDVVFLASEFPNDNPALHGGVIWVCLEPTARPTPEVVPLRVVARTIATVEHVSPTIFDVGANDDEDMIVVEELAPLDEAIEIEEMIAEPIVVFDSVAPSCREANDSSALPPPSDDAFTTLVCTLADVAIGAGSPQVASMLPGLLFDARVPDALDEAAATTLKAAGIWDGEAVTDQFVATVTAWRAILRGTSDDFSACGSMLDEWASGLLARLLDAEATAPRLRQELRTRGVAAFGLSA